MPANTFKGNNTGSSGDPIDLTVSQVKTSLAYTAADVGAQPSDATLTALAAFNTTGFVVQTASDTFTGRSLSAPASGFTITNPAGTAGNPTFALANDLAAVEGLSTNGIAVRAGTDAWNTRTISAANNKVAVTNGDGVSGNPIIGVNEANFTGIPSSAISDLTENVQDIVAAQLVEGSNITLTYNDAAGTLTIDAAGGGSGITRTIVTTSGSATLPSDASTDYAVFIVGAHNQTMPTAVGNTNKYDIKNNHIANVTILTTSSQTIDGTTTISLSPQSAVTLISNGSNWSIF
jgi:hypothetical protein